MGDADAEVVIQIPAQEIEGWMDEALGVVDEGFDDLLGLVMNLHERTKAILRELKILEGFRKIFISLNFFIVPVVIAIMLCYGTNNSVQTYSSGMEIGFQILVMLLMFMSSAVGLPLYLVSVWESYKAFESMSEDPSIHSLSNESESPPSLLEDSLLTQLSPDASLERLNEFVRLLNERMPRRMRAGLQRRRSTENETSEEGPGMEDSSEMDMESTVADATTSVEPREEKQQDESHGFEDATVFPILYQFHVLMNEQSPELAVRLEATKRAKAHATAENGVVLNQRDMQLAETQVAGPSTAGNDE